MPSHARTFIVPMLSFIPFASSTCYAPNGTAVFDWGPDSVYQPCSSDSSSPLSTICCATNRDNPPGGSISNGFTADICMPNGLCQNILENDSGELVYSYWRDYCTQEDWTSGECLNVCTNAGQHSEDETASMTPCGPDPNTVTRWCCGTNNTACCSSDDPAIAMHVPVSLGVEGVSSTAISSSTASATGTTATLASSSGTSTAETSTNQDRGSDGLSTGAKAGIGVGAAIGAALVIGLAMFTIRMRKRKGSQDGSPRDMKDVYSNGDGGYNSVGASGYYPPQAYELRRGISEVGGGEIAEMGVGGPRGSMEKYAQDHTQESGVGLVGKPREKQEPVELA